MQRLIQCLRVASLCIFVSVSIAGCGGGGGKPVPKLADPVPVSGLVTLDGQPLADATIMFLPELESGFHGATGRTDSSGKYELTTDIGNGKTSKGAIPGKYKVTVSKLIKPDGTPVPAGNKEPPMNLGAHESIPFQFSALSQTRLVFDVAATGGTIDIPVASQ